VIFPWTVRSHLAKAELLHPIKRTVINVQSVFVKQITYKFILKSHLLKVLTLHSIFINFHNRKVRHVVFTII